jgi:double-stranded uracil-DNA glycosylase
MKNILPDLLQPGLRLVVCGTAVGTQSAERGAYYAGRGNKFWRVLHETGLTPVRLQPEDYSSLVGYGIGLTDLAKHHSGSDAELPSGCFDRDALSQKVRAIEPSALAFNGKRAAVAFYGKRTIDYGRQQDAIGRTAIYVLPSTSGAANACWSEVFWREMAQDLAGE